MMISFISLGILFFIVTYNMANRTMTHVLNNIDKSDDYQYIITRICTYTQSIPKTACLLHLTYNFIEYFINISYAIWGCICFLAYFRKKIFLLFLSEFIAFIIIGEFSKNYLSDIIIQYNNKNIAECIKNFLLDINHVHTINNALYLFLVSILAMFTISMYFLIKSDRQKN